VFWISYLENPLPPRMRQYGIKAQHLANDWHLAAIDGRKAR